MSCCTNTYDIGCLSHCSTVSLPDQVGIGEDGTWTFQIVKPDMSVVTTTADLTEGDDIAFSNVDFLSPNAAYTFTVLDANGDPYSYVDYEGNTYDCFSFYTVFTI